MEAPRLLGITPAEFSAEALGNLLPELALSLDALLLRWPGRSARSTLEGARQLAAITARPRLLLSDRLDIARAAGLDGVQLKENSLPVQSIPENLRPALLGASRHDAAGVLAASGCDYLTVSPLHSTTSKPGVPALGIDELRRLVALSKIPVLALGGVLRHHVPEILESGAHGVAVSGGIFAASDPVSAAAGYAEALREARRA